MGKDFNIMKAAMNGIMQTEEWNRSCLDNPEIIEASNVLSMIEGQLSSKLPDDHDLLNAMSDAVTGLLDAYSTAATLYGIHVALNIMSAAANPGEYSQYLMSKLPVSA